jgi:putative endonuclease
VGAYGERVAARFLARVHGYRLLLKNYSTARGEIDLICRHHNVLVFVEVRTRADETFGLPVESINETKRQHLRRVGEYYIQQLEDPDGIFTRYDAVSVFLQPGVIPECLLHPDLFQMRI